jgi:hypothetical protein
VQDTRAEAKGRADGQAETGQSLWRWRWAAGRVQVGAGAEKTRIPSPDGSLFLGAGRRSTRSGAGTSAATALATRSGVAVVATTTGAVAAAAGGLDIARITCTCRRAAPCTRAAAARARTGEVAEWALRRTIGRAAIALHRCLLTGGEARRSRQRQNCLAGRPLAAGGHTVQGHPPASRHLADEIKIVNIVQQHGEHLALVESARITAITWSIEQSSPISDESAAWTNQITGLLVYVVVSEGVRHTQTEQSRGN